MSWATSKSTIDDVDCGIDVLYIVTNSIYYSSCRFSGSGVVFRWAAALFFCRAQFWRQRGGPKEASVARLPKLQGPTGGRRAALGVLLQPVDTGQWTGSGSQGRPQWH